MQIMEDRTVNFSWPLWLTVAVLAGCGCSRPEATLASLDRPMILAVAPAMNHSGSEDLDPLRAADLMASELTTFEGVTVVGVNRVLAQLSADGQDRVESPAHALQVVDRLGVDGIVVFAITEYEPYWPPVVAVSAQLYGYGARHPQRFDPVQASRQAAPATSAAADRPRVEVQRLFHGRSADIRDEIQAYARKRCADESPYGWRRYLVSQEDFLRFCCHSVLQDLIRQEVTHVVAQHERRNEGSRP